MTFAPDALPGGRDTVACQEVERGVSGPMSLRHRSIAPSISHAKANFGIPCMFIGALLEFYYDMFVTALQKCKWELQEEVSLLKNWSARVEARPCSDPYQGTKFPVTKLGFPVPNCREFSQKAQ